MAADRVKRREHHVTDKQPEIRKAKQTKTEILFDVYT